MNTSKITFPKRISKIIDIRYSNFESSSGDTIHRVDVQVENGDNFTSFSPKGNFFKSLAVGSKIEYIMIKTKEGKTKIESLKLANTKTKKMKPLISNLSGISLESLLFIDIETVRVTNKLTNKGTPLYESWAYKRRKEGETTAAQLKKSYQDKAPLYSEFAKVVCISIGMVKKDGEVFIQSYYGDSEEEVLNKFIGVLNAFVKKYSNLRLCGHSIIGFDIPFLVRRLIVNKIQVPDYLNVIDEKPWTLVERFIDVAQWWKNTGFYGASLINMAVALGIESPKQEIDGSKVSDTYYGKKNGVIEITKYCEKDVHCVIQIVQHLYNIERTTSFVSKTFEN